MNRRRATSPSELFSRLSPVDIERDTYLSCSATEALDCPVPFLQYPLTNQVRVSARLFLHRGPLITMPTVAGQNRTSAARKVLPDLSGSF
jgi:hypothetical protein